MILAVDEVSREEQLEEERQFEEEQEAQGDVSVRMTYSYTCFVTAIYRNNSYNDGSAE